MDRISGFAKEKVCWTRKMNLKLVKFMKNRPSIWNPKHPKYTSVDFRDNTYAEFALKYGNAFSGQAVKDRWTNIRSTFANYVRKINASRLKGEEYNVNWHLWEACQFLSGIKRSTDTITNTDKTEYGYLSNDGSHNSTDIDLSSDYDTERVPTESRCKLVAENLLQVFKGVQNDAFGIDNTKHGKIGRAVAKKLSQMSSLNAATACVKITEILFLYDESNPENPNNIKME